MGKEREGEEREGEGEKGEGREGGGGETRVGEGRDISRMVVSIPWQHCDWVSLKHDGLTGRTTGQTEWRATDDPPTHALAGVWPIGQDDGPPDFILHVLSHGVINAHYCT